jgi:glycosyltransferase involved in cell wall biosynthesis
MPGDAVHSAREASGPIRVLELRSVRGTGGGPEKTILSGAAQADHSKYEITVCYIRDRRDDVFGIDQRASAAQVDYVEILEKHSFDVGIWPQLRKLVRDRQIDIVHAHEYKTDLVTLLLARYERVIPLATAHGWTGHSARERLVYYPLDRKILARFAAVIAVSEQIRGEIIAAGAPPGRVLTILNGIDNMAFKREPGREPAARAALGFERADFVIGAVGRLEPQKRFDLLIEACAALQARYPKLRLVIAGDGSLRAELEAQAARDLGPGTWRFIGHVSDVSAVHHGLDLLVQSSDYEGTPNAVLEAMAFETPIVATSAGGTAQLVTNGAHALVIEPGRAGVLASAIEQVLVAPAAARARAIEARRKIDQELSFEQRMRKVEAVYDSLAGRRRSPTGTGPALQWV